MSSIHEEENEDTPVLSIEEDSEDTRVLSIEEYKQQWVACEEKKIEPRQVLKQIGKTQRPATKAIRLFMDEHQLTSLDCGGGWFITCEEVEKVSFSEDICSSYMEPVALERLKKEQVKRRSTFKTLPPPAKNQRLE
jgi:hypothetical protein